MHTDAFLKAAKEGDLSTLKRLAAEEPAVLTSRAASGETALMAALYSKQEDAAEWLIAAGVPLDIFAAAAAGDVESLERGLAGGVNTYSYDGWTPLHLAAFFGRLAAAERLIAAGADLNAVSRNALRNTPLHAAVAGGHVDVSLRLIEAGADVNVADAGKHTPFHIAAEAGYVPIARALFDRGADAHVVDAEDRTPLSRAAAKGHTEIVDLINVVE
jgi:uncharacterized protein